MATERGRQQARAEQNPALQAELCLPQPAGDHRKAALLEPHPFLLAGEERNSSEPSDAGTANGNGHAKALRGAGGQRMLEGQAPAASGVKQQLRLFFPPSLPAKIILLFLLGSFHLIFCFIQQPGFSPQRDDGSLSRFLFSPEDRSSGKQREGFLRSITLPYRQASHRLPPARVAG